MMKTERGARRKKAEPGDQRLSAGNRHPRISVRNRQRKIFVDPAEIETFANNALKHCLQLRKGKRTNLRKLHEIFVWLISDRRISQLHRQFFGIGGPTDVITFQAGEIFISVETAARYAPEFGNSVMTEIKVDIVHGLLHLHGFDDRTPADARRMHATQERIVHCALK